VGKVKNVSFGGDRFEITPEVAGVVEEVMLAGTCGCGAGS
jgi:hypothetical protein